MGQARWRMVVLALLIGLGLLAGCGSGGDYGSGEAAPAPGQPEREALSEFAESCEQEHPQWRTGQVDYPAVLPARLDQPTSYIVNLDVHGQPASTTSYLPSESRNSAPIEVQCVVAARLSGVTPGISVAAPLDGWQFADFTASGVITFDWTVTPTATTEQQLRLEIKPAVQSVVSRDFAAADSRTFLTAVPVESSWPQRAWAWIETNFGSLLLILGALGALSVLGLVVRPIRFVAGRLSRATAGASEAVGEGAAAPAAEEPREAADPAEPTPPREP